MSYAIFTRAKGSRFAYVDRFGNVPGIIELPITHRTSPAAYMNKQPDVSDYVDVAPHIAQELADAAGVKYETFTTY